MRGKIRHHFCEDNMSGEISRTNPGPPADGPYVPSWCYPNNKPRICVCKCHEGYHNDHGECIRKSVCGCKGIQLCSKPGCGYPDGRPCIGCGLIVYPKKP